MYTAPLTSYSPFRQWILDAIPVIGTPAALRFIKEKFLADEMTVAETAQALIASVHMVTADTEAIKLVKVGKSQSKLLGNGNKNGGMKYL